MKVKSPKRWYLAADAARAMAYVRRADGATYERIASWTSELALPSSRPPDATDRHGRVFDNIGSHRHAAETVSPRESLKQAFGRGLAQALNRARSDGLFESLVLFAPARFLHGLRDNFDKHTIRSVAHSEAKDLTRLPEDKLFDVFDSLGNARTNRSRLRFPLTARR